MNAFGAKYVGAVAALAWVTSSCAFHPDLGPLGGDGEGLDTDCDTSPFEAAFGQLTLASCVLEDDPNDFAGCADKFGGRAFLTQCSVEGFVSGVCQTDDNCTGDEVQVSIEGEDLRPCSSAPAYFDGRIACPLCLAGVPRGLAMQFNDSGNNRTEAICVDVDGVDP